MTSPKPIKPAQHAESFLLSAILQGDYPPGSAIPAERELSEKIGVTRPTLREALQRMARDGWLDIRHGKPTIVRDYKNEGGMGVIAAMTRLADRLPSDFISHFLGVRAVLLPAISKMATDNRPEILEACLVQSQHLADTPEAFAEYDWHLQLEMAACSGNPFFRVILNDFTAMYNEWGLRYFQARQARVLSTEYYATLLQLVRNRDGVGVEARVRRTLTEVTMLWKSLLDASEDEA